MCWPRTSHSSCERLGFEFVGANAFLVSFWYKKTQLLQSEGCAGESPPSSMRVALNSISECLVQTEHEGIVRDSAISLVEKPVKVIPILSSRLSSSLLEQAKALT
jgi:hypothetical protein